MAVRGEALNAVPEFRAGPGGDTFASAEVVAQFAAPRHAVGAGIIRSRVVARMCAHAPGHRDRVHDDLERAGRGVCRLRRQS